MLSSTQVGQINYSLNDMIKYFELKANSFRAGQLRFKIENWKQITSDYDILLMITGTKLEFVDRPLQNNFKQSLNDEEKSLIREEIVALLRKNVIVYSNHEENQIVSPIFLTNKKDGSHRMILNLKKLNENIQYKHFKMEMLSQAIQLLTPYCFMASVDFKDAY